MISPERKRLYGSFTAIADNPELYRDLSDRLVADMRERSPLLRALRDDRPATEGTRD